MNSKNRKRQQKRGEREAHLEARSGEESGF